MTSRRFPASSRRPSRSMPTSTARRVRSSSQSISSSANVHVAGTYTALRSEHVEVWKRMLIPVDLRPVARCFERLRYARDD